MTYPEQFLKTAVVGAPISQTDNRWHAYSDEKMRRVGHHRRPES
jgi:hypothetical protein